MTNDNLNQLRLFVPTYLKNIHKPNCRLFQKTRAYVMEKGISYLLAVMQRRSLPAIATFAAVIGGAIAYLAITPHLYSASARLILDDKRVSISDLGRDLTQVR